MTMTDQEVRTKILTILLTSGPLDASGIALRAVLCGVPRGAIFETLKRAEKEGELIRVSGAGRVDLCVTRLGVATIVEHCTVGVDDISLFCVAGGAVTEGWILRSLRDAGPADYSQLALRAFRDGRRRSTLIQCLFALESKGDVEIVLSDLGMMTWLTDPGLLRAEEYDVL